MPLPTNRRETVTLADYFDRQRPLTQQQIGKKFSIGRAAVAMRIKRGKAKLVAAGFPLPDRPGTTAPKLYQMPVPGRRQK